MDKAAPAHHPPKNGSKAAGRKSSKDSTHGTQTDSSSAIKDIRQLLSGGGTDQATGSGSSSSTGPNRQTRTTNWAGVEQPQAWGSAAWERVDQPLPAQAAPPPQAAPDRKDIQSKLNQTNAALTNLPQTPEFDTIRMQIEAEQESYKEMLRGMRPVGSRLDSAKQSLQKMRANAEVLRQAKEMAAAALEQAEEDIVSKMAEVTQLEREVATASSSSLRALQGAMEDAVANMACDMNQDMALAAATDLTSLFRNLSLMEAAATAASNQSVQARVDQRPSGSNTPASSTAVQGGPASTLQLPLGSHLALLNRHKRDLDEVDAGDEGMEAGADYPHDWQEHAEEDL